MPAVQLMMSTAAQAALFYPNNHSGMRYAATLGHLQRLEMSPHLGTIPIGPPRVQAIDPYSIARARVGAMALGVHVNRFLVCDEATHPSFCPCCQWQSDPALTLETIGHHLCGECSASAHLAHNHMRPLLQLMHALSPGWYQCYVRTATVGGKAAMILSAADAPLENPRDRAKISGIVNAWLSAIALNHPLCIKQRVGAAIMLLAYRNMPYGCGPWTARETAAIKSCLHGSDNALFTAVPSRSHAACKRKRKELIAEADDGARSNTASGQERRRCTRQRLLTFAPPKPKPSTNNRRPEKRERSKRQHQHRQHRKRKERKGRGRGGDVEKKNWTRK